MPQKSALRRSWKALSDIKPDMMQGEGIRIREAGRGVAEDMAGRMDVPGVRAKKDALN